MVFSSGTSVMCMLASFYLYSVPLNILTLLISFLICFIIFTYLIYLLHYCAFCNICSPLYFKFCLHFCDDFAFSSFFFPSSTNFLFHSCYCLVIALWIIVFSTLKCFFFHSGNCFIKYFKIHDEIFGYVFLFNPWKHTSDGCFL